MANSDSPTLSEMFREIADELAAAGTPMPVLPDEPDAEIDALFWAAVDARMRGRSDDPTTP